MSTRFGMPSGRYESGTEQEFNDALKKWKKARAPWIMFYFRDQPLLSSDPADVEQYLKVCQFRKRLETLGLVGSYKEVRGREDAFFEKVSEHLRNVISELPKMKAPSAKLRQAPAKQKSPPKPVVPPEYLTWLLHQCGDVELMGLQLKEGLGVRLNQVYTPLITSARFEKEGPPRRKRDDEVPAEPAASREALQLLLALLAERSLYVFGDPGSGKSTFCRWVTWLTCNGAMPPPDLPDLAVPEPYQEKLPGELRGRRSITCRSRSSWQPSACSSSSPPTNCLTGRKAPGGREGDVQMLRRGDMVKGDAETW